MWLLPRNVFFSFFIEVLMKIEKIKETQIFKGMSDKEIASVLKHLSSFEKKYRKGSTILHSGFTTDKMGLILEGSITIESNDQWGNKTILSHIGEGEFFAETYGFLSTQPLLVDVVANQNCRILFLQIANLKKQNGVHFDWITKFVLNLLAISMQKNIILSGRSFLISAKTIRGRVIAYLDSVSIQKKKSEFDIPFDRQQLADYLNVERTALSKELMKMKQDGLIDFYKNHFILLAAKTN